MNGIPENLSSLRAIFEGVGVADLTPFNESAYTGLSPGMLIYNHGNGTEWSSIQSVII